MKRSERPIGDYSLKRSNILRGFKVFSEILNDSKVFQTGLIKAYVRTQPKEPNTKNSVSPLVTDNVKVGFIIAKKYIKKSVFRNRLKRLLRESYRLNKPEIEVKAIDFFIIYSLTSDGYRFFREFPLTKQNIAGNEMKILNQNIKKYTEKI